MVNHPLHGERRVDGVGRAGVPDRDTSPVAVCPAPETRERRLGVPIVRILGKCGSFKFS
jgi:hypothetical protein